jgi:hypothetical protein
MNNNFNYQNTETTMKGGSKIIRNVTIKKGRGTKSITKYHKGKKISSVKRPIHKKHVYLIRAGKFIPGLFSDCKCKNTRKRA